MDVPGLPNPFVHVGSSESTSEWFYNTLDVHLIDRSGKVVNVHMKDGTTAPIGCPSEEAAVRLFDELYSTWRDTWLRWREGGAIK